jgi:hypothetical protein
MVDTMGLTLQLIPKRIISKPTKKNPNPESIDVIEIEIEREDEFYLRFNIHRPDLEILIKDFDILAEFNLNKLPSRLPR